MVNNNKILYENWVKNQKEEDQVFVFEKGVIIVFFERLLKFELDENSPIGMFSFNSNFNNLSKNTIITPFSNTNTWSSSF